VNIDGQDLKELDLAHLRTQIGVVLQENFLFRGTVRENIAMTKPAASLDEVVRVAQLAGAQNSSSGCRKAIRRSSRKARPICRAASGSAWRSRAPSSTNRRC
jgi:ABC-type transport system involved in cytochrome bd biosynthesis fused ATPase/permease subunit